MIKITKELLNNWFDDINSLYFNGELIAPKSYVISNNRSIYGQFRPSTWCIEISTAWVRSERDYYNTFLHELCHLYVRQKYGCFVQPHGYEWKEIANIITKKTNGKYGIIQRTGGGQDRSVLRSAKMEKFVVFYDYNNNLSIAKYRNDEYVTELINSNGVKNGTEMYFFVSDDVELADYTMRKVNTKRIYWNYLRDMTIGDVEKRSTLINTMLYNNIAKDGIIQSTLSKVG